MSRFSVTAAIVLLGAAACAVPPSPVDEQDTDFLAGHWPPVPFIALDDLPHGVPGTDRFDDTLCHEFCHWAGHCIPDHDEFAAGGSCHSYCLDLLADDRYVNAACYVASCSERERCLVPEVLGIPEACRTICQDVESCYPLVQLGLPPERFACEVMCAGRAVAYDSFADALDCLAERAATCDISRAMDCFADGRSFCGPICEELLGCVGDPLVRVFPDAANCYDECGRRTANEAQQYRRCFDKFECHADRRCLDAAPTRFCAQYADAVFERCQGATWPPAREQMIRECSLSLAGFEVPLNPDMIACLDGLTGQVFEADGVIIHLGCGLPNDKGPPPCSFVAPAHCATASARIEECMGIPVPIADQFCMHWLLEGEAAAHHIIDCIERASCENVAACIDNHGAAFCERYCARANECGLAPENCITGCRSALADGDTSLVANLECARGRSCMEAASCFGRPPPAEEPDCQQACRRDSAACHHVIIGFDTGHRACTAVCSDAIERSGTFSDPTLARCMVSTIDHDCRLGSVDDCL